MTSISRSRENAILIVIGLTGLFFFLILYPRVQPSAQMDIEVDRREALRVTEAHLADLIGQENTNNFSNRSISFSADNKYESYFALLNAMPDERERIIKHSAPYFWNVTYTNPSSRERYLFKVSIDGIIFQRTYTHRLYGWPYRSAKHEG